MFLMDWNSVFFYIIMTVLIVYIEIKTMMILVELLFMFIWNVRIGESIISVIVVKLFVFSMTWVFQKPQQFLEFAQQAVNQEQETETTDLPKLHGWSKVNMVIFQSSSI